MFSPCSQRADNVKKNCLCRKNYDVFKFEIFTPNFKNTGKLERKFFIHGSDGFINGVDTQMENSNGNILDVQYHHSCPCKMVLLHTRL